MDEIKKKQLEIEGYYNQYTGRQRNIGINKRHYSILDKLIASGLKNTDNVLELGCGIGTFTSLISKFLKNGSIVSMDISGSSIEIAKKKVLQKWVRFIHADVTEYDFNKELRFNCIVLPDVLEHIPIELHDNLFKKLSQLLTNEGFIFIHIPNPYYLTWCHKNRPEMLQIIDQPITTDILVKNSYSHGLYIQELKTYSIWVRDNDYQYIVLKKNGNQSFEHVIMERTSFVEKIKTKINGFRK